MTKPARRLAELVLTLRILLVAVAVPALLRLTLDRLQSVLEPRKPLPERDPAELQTLVDRIERVLAAGRPLVRTGCLTRGVTLYYFLRRAGVDVSLVFGLGKPGDAFAGHCWLVKDGQPFLEKTDPRSAFTEMYSIPKGASVSRA